MADANDTTEEFDLGAAARELAPLALATLAELVRDEAADAQVRIAAAGALIDRGLAPARCDETAVLRRALARLQALRRKQARARARRAQAEARR